MDRSAHRGLIVAAVDPDSPADRTGLRVGDVIGTVAGMSVLDEPAFRFQTSGVRATVGIQRDSSHFEVKLDCRSGEPPGVTFEELLGDGVHTCNNKCVFCFIHQMPRRMRRSLYVMDDDFRLSFTHGNYVTLTKMDEADFERIAEQRLTPLYISVHATDPDLRGSLLGKRTAAPVLPRLGWLAERGISTHAQIVLCPGLNDGAALDRTVHDLAELHSSMTGRRAGVQSVAVVPVGLTRYRERLTPLTAPDSRYAAEMLSWLKRRQAGLSARLGTRFVWLSDEWYYLSGRPVPGRRHYEGFPQLEDGVGTSRLFLDEMKSLTRRLPARAPTESAGTLVTGELARGLVFALSNSLNAVDGIALDVVAVANTWFGGTISVAGLLTACDIVGALAGHGGSGDVFIPDVCLRDGDAFLDDVTPDEVGRSVGRRIRIVPSSPRGLAAALGLTRASRVR